MNVKSVAIVGLLIISIINTKDTTQKPLTIADLSKEILFSFCTDKAQSFKRQAENLLGRYKDHCNGERLIERMVEIEGKHEYMPISDDEAARGLIIKLERLNKEIEKVATNYKCDVTFQFLITDINNAITEIKKFHQINTPKEIQQPPISKQK